MSAADSEPSNQRVPNDTDPTRLTRSEWILILALAAIQFTHIVDFVIIMPLGGRLMRELAISPSQFACVVSAYSLTAAITSLLAASVIDRFDRRTVLLTLYAGFGLSTLLCGLAPNYELLLVSRALAGAFGGLAASSIQAVIGDVFPDARRGRASGAVMSAFAVASIIGLPMGLWIAPIWGRGAPFVVLAGVCVAVWIAVANVMPRMVSHRQRERRPALTQFLAVVKHPGHVYAFAFTFCMLLGTFTVGSFIGPTYIANGGFTEHDLALAYAGAGVLTLFTMNMIGRLADRMDRLKLFRILGTLTICMTLLITNVLPESLWLACLFAALFMGSASGRMVPAQAMLVGVPPPQMRGGFLSLNTAVQHLGSAIAPLLAGMLITKDADGKLLGYPLVGVLAVTMAILSLILAGWLKPNSRATMVQVATLKPTGPKSKAGTPAEPATV